MADKDFIECVNSIISLYESLKDLEVKGGEYDVFRAYASDLNDELARLPYTDTILNLPQKAREFIKRLCENAIDWIELVLLLNIKDVKFASTLIRSKLRELVTILRLLSKGG